MACVKQFGLVNCTEIITANSTATTAGPASAPGGASSAQAPPLQWPPALMPLGGPAAETSGDWSYSVVVGAVVGGVLGGVLLLVAVLTVAILVRR